MKVDKHVFPLERTPQKKFFTDCYFDKEGVCRSSIHFRDLRRSGFCSSKLMNRISFSVWEEILESKGRESCGRI